VSPLFPVCTRMSSRQASSGALQQVLLRRNVAKALRDEATAGCPPTVFSPGPSAGVNMRRTARVSIEERRGASLVKMLQRQRHPMIWQTSSRCRYAAPVNLFRRGPTGTCLGSHPGEYSGHYCGGGSGHHPCSDVRHIGCTPPPRVLPPLVRSVPPSPPLGDDSRQSCGAASPRLP
jgi:hypothetical protein